MELHNNCDVLAFFQRDEAQWTSKRVDRETHCGNLETDSNVVCIPHFGAQENIDVGPHIETEVSVTCGGPELVILQNIANEKTELRILLADVAAKEPPKTVWTIITVCNSQANELLQEATVKQKTLKPIAD